MRRSESRNAFFVQRIPADVRQRAAGNRLAIPLGESFAFVTPSVRAQSIRFSLKTADPVEIKTRQATAAAHLEGIWTAMREDAPVRRTNPVSP